MIKKTVGVGLLVALCIFTGFSFAKKVYKSKDAQGNVIFSDSPQAPNAEAIILYSPATNTQPQPSSHTDTQTAEISPSKTPPPPPEDPEWTARVKEACTGYQKNLSRLQETGRRVYTVNGQGEYHYLSDEERQKAIEELQQDIATHCQNANSK